jgi:hypothetical protein
LPGKRNKISESLIHTWLRKVLLPSGGYPAKLTSKEDILSLIAKLRPIRGQHELIRLGPDEDGGYLVPDDLEGIVACFSPGVNTVSRFEADLAERGMDVFLADYSVDGPAEMHKKFHFQKKFLGATSNDIFMTLDNWVADSCPGSEDLLLQIDIEGYEYETFLSTSEALMKRFRIIVVEFHNLHHFWNKLYFQQVAPAYEKILQTHTCVHIHPNTSTGSVKIKGLELPKALEVTFHRKDRVGKTDFVSHLPHPLDRDNIPGKSLVLDPVFYTEQ